MAATLPRASRPSYGPPTSALPALPLPKTRKSTSGMQLPTERSEAPSTPRSGLRTPSSSSLQALRSPGLPKVPTSPGNNEFTPSPLSGGAAPGTATSTGESSRRESSEINPTNSGSGKPRKRPTAMANPSTQSAISGSMPTLLNGSGDSISISSGAGARGSDGLLSLPSPPQSRSSSAQDSYSTSVTTTEELGDGFRGREGPDDADKRSSKPAEGKGNVIVSVRVRPDANSQGKQAGVTENGYVRQFFQVEVANTVADNVFSQQDNNAKVYDASAKRLVRRVMEGYHGTVFAYGMTGTGKTFSMQGTDKMPGVIPLAITDIFSYIRETPSREFLLRVSYLEIYNEKIHDLLSASTGPATGPGAVQTEEIKLREDSKRGVRTDSGRISRANSWGAAMNDNKRGGMSPGGVRVSTLSLIDLAGSERAAETKERRTEGSHINKSLLTLGTVIARLSGNKDKDGKPMDKDGKHLPYRDSKLTRLLQGALSGGSLVSILCTISVGSGASAAGPNSHTSETLNTLKFASRAAANIVSHAKKADEASNGGGDGTTRALLERYRMEIADLKKQLDGQAKAKFIEEDQAQKEEARARHNEQLIEMQLARTALKERIDHLNRLILSSKSTGVNTNGTYSALSMRPRLSMGASNGHMSSMSVRSSMTPSTITLDRANSVSTIGRRASAKRLSGTVSGDHTSMEDDESVGEYGNGNASLAAQNRALQADLADKTRYCQTLEKRLLHARRSSQSRTSLQFGSKSSIMVGEDHGISNLLRDKDAEIADLRARLDDKDRMLSALRSSARSRDTAERDPRHTLNQGMPMSPVSARESQLYEPGLTSAGGSAKVLPPTVLPPTPLKNSKSVDEMSKMLDEMIQDRIENEQVNKDVRGSMRAGERKRAVSTDPIPGIEPLKSPHLSPTAQPHDSGVVVTDLFKKSEEEDL
ncbi:kinesin-II 85 kda subunit [Botrytis cinerea]